MEINEFREKLFGLCGVSAPSGCEKPAAQRVAELFAPYVSESRIDSHFDYIGIRRCGRENAKTVLLDAHIDEIGFIVTGIDEEGFLRFKPLGLDPRTLPGREVTVLGKRELPGIITCLPPHMLSAEQMDKSFAVSELAIDIGYGKEEAEKLVRVGTRAVARAEYFALAGDSITGKAFDDRVGLMSFLHALELLKDEELEVDVCVLGSVQEEFSGMGAICAGFAVCPDYAVAVDVGHARTPDAPSDKTFEPGGGPMIGVGPHLTGSVTRALREAAKRLDMKYQVEVIPGQTGTNAGDFQINRGGIATGLVSIPLKYMHTPFETVRLSDVTDTGRLIAEFIRGCGGESHV